MQPKMKGEGRRVMKRFMTVAAALLFAIVFSSCAAHRLNGPSATAPNWVHDCRAHPKSRGAIMCAVGMSDFVDTISRRADAETAARAELAKSFSATIAVTEKSFLQYLRTKGVETDEQMVNSVNSILSNVRLANSEIVDHWIDPKTNYEYALGVYKLADFRQSIARMKDEDPLARQALIKEGAALFEMLPKRPVDGQTGKN